MTKKILIIVIVVMFGLANRSFALEGKAIIQDSSDPTKTYGGVLLVDSPEGLKIDANFTGVPNPGKHGFHIHENGSCDEKGSAAGGHYNPMKSKHGFFPKDGHSAAHMGDMGNIEVTTNGSAKTTVVLPDITLTGGDHNVEGRAIILHEKADDFGQPTGNAGGRIGCGLIQLLNPAPVTAVQTPASTPPSTSATQEAPAAVSNTVSADVVATPPETKTENIIKTP